MTIAFLSYSRIIKMQTEISIFTGRKHTMCQLINISLGDRNVSVASIKSEYIKNIADCASRCGLIDKVVLFGSALEERCTDESDIDIAVFGKESKNKVLKSRYYRDYVNSVVSFGSIQDYDILYFDTNKSYASDIMKNIEAGAVIYER